MTEEIFHIASLIRKHFREELTEAEKVELNKWLDNSAANQRLFEEVNNAAYISHTLKSWDKYNDARIAAKIAEQIPSFKEEEPGESINERLAPVHRIHFLRTAWFRYAAAVIIIFGIGAYLWNIRKEKPSVATVNPLPVKNDVAPGGNKALLILADGSTIVLDSAANGAIAKQEMTTIRKSADGQIIYEANSSPVSRLPSAVLYNTMRTPKGGQYQLTLPDGSKVWLNAASSITYPTTFNGSTREVSMTGEAYFEVAKNRSKPFVVKTTKEEIRVLGTEFNVNAYEDEAAMKTSLLEGSVKIGNKTLRPGQAYISGHVVQTNTQQDVAWKNGYFNFDKADLPAVLRQLSRWYDIEVKYEGPVKRRVFRGELQRNLTLMQITNILKEMDVKFRLENRTLFVQ
jgi:transmembrane sensor